LIPEEVSAVAGSASNFESFDTDTDTASIGRDELMEKLLKEFA
jgi:hypothetical protein